jgi:hypothetical protein
MSQYYQSFCEVDANISKHFSNFRSNDPLKIFGCVDTSHCFEYILNTVISLPKYLPISLNKPT